MTLTLDTPTSIKPLDETATPRERFIAALERRPLKGLVPTFELVFFLTMEAFGRPHPSQRHYHQWDQMTQKERDLHIADMAKLYVETAERYGHSAIFLHPNPSSDVEMFRLIDKVRDLSGDKYFLMMHGDATYSIPDGNSMVDFSCKMADEPEVLLKQAQDMVDQNLRYIEKVKKHGGLDGFALCADYCLNEGPFMSPKSFSKFVTPFLKQVVKNQRDMGFYVIKHTDGDIMPIIDQLVDCNPHALHSIDPQAGVDIAEVKRLYGDKVCLAGNVNCGLIDTGTEEQAIESARYALKHGMPGGGYIFCTSNCVYTGMRLERYELILDVWYKEGRYP